MISDPEAVEFSTVESAGRWQQSAEMRERGKFAEIANAVDEENE